MASISAVLLVAFVGIVALIRSSNDVGLQYPKASFVHVHGLNNQHTHRRHRHRHLVHGSVRHSTIRQLGLLPSSFQQHEQDRTTMMSSTLSKSANIPIGLSKLKLAASKNDDGQEDVETSSSSLLAESDQLILGVVGTIASLITLYSEYTLKMTGCGLPSGPFGLIGLVEGLSYLSVSGLVVYSVITKVQTDNGLPAGPYGLLGAAEGLSFLTIVIGLVVLALQITSYGYIPNAVPMEGGMCS